MNVTVKWVAAAAAAAGVLIGGGCAIVDQYSQRAVVYNLQAEQAQNQALLLNIVRAYLRRPMQFTTVSTITGTATASGGVQYTLPTQTPFRPTTNGSSIASFPPLPTWNFTGSMSGGPAFSVPVLDTQEFYEGILKPIPGQLYDLYIQAGYPVDLLFNLFVEKITITRRDDGHPRDFTTSRQTGSRYSCSEDNHQPGCEFTFLNYVGTDMELHLFQAMADHLLALGLTTEGVSSPTVDFKNPHNVNIRYVGAPSSGNKDQVQVVAPPGGGAAAAAEGAQKQFAFCFRPRTASDADCVGGPRSPELCGQSSGRSDASWNTHRRDQLACTGSTASSSVERFFKLSNGGPGRAGTSGAGLKAMTDQNATLQGGTPKSNIIISEQFALKLKNLADAENRLHPPLENHPEIRQLGSQLYEFRNKPVIISFTLRSVEAMIYYLGEVARRRLAAELAPPATVYVKEGPPYAAYPEADRCTDPEVDLSCNPLFVLKENDPAPDDFVSVGYDGRVFSLSGGPDGGLSSSVLDLLRQQIAVNSSAKSLPQSSVISVVGQ